MGVTNRTDNEHELQDLLSGPPPHPVPSFSGTSSCLRRAAHSLGCFRGNTDHRDGHTAYKPAPHLGYELEYQGLSTLVMGPMTMAHLGSQPLTSGVSIPLTHAAGSEEMNAHILIKFEDETLGD